MKTDAVKVDRVPARPRLQRASLTEQLEQALRVDIIEGILKPGERLRPADVEQRYGVSATPLREALRHLAAEGLVVLEPNHGARVAPASLADLRDIYLARSILESEALRLTIRQMDDEWRSKLREAMDRLQTVSLRINADSSRAEVLAWSEAHRSFHLALFAGCPSRWLSRFIMALYDHSERYRMLTVAGSPRRNTIVEHQEIFEAVVRGDADRAVASLRHHLASTVGVLDQAMGTQGSVTGEEAGQ